MAHVAIIARLLPGSQDGAMRYADVDQCVHSEPGAGPMQRLTATLPTVVPCARLVTEQDQAHTSAMGTLG
jgi:hypothetical protein